MTAVRYARPHHHIHIHTVMYRGVTMVMSVCLGKELHKRVFQDGYHGINSRDGCRPCECNQSGSLSASCDEEGRCQCITGVTGDKCDRCDHGYYNFRENGCTRKNLSCPSLMSHHSRHVLLMSRMFASSPACDCAHTHGNCNAETGECICPPHTHGAKCEECETNHWGHDTVSGCTVRHADLIIIL